VLIADPSLSRAVRPSEFSSPSKLPITACPTRQIHNPKGTICFWRSYRSVGFHPKRNLAVHGESRRLQFFELASGMDAPTRSADKF